ncbi:MAG: serine/threonine-protein kinase [Clostridia bacterium]|nr:serine/threonine-protein kinase [Clostridia bacterium]
MIPDRMTVNGKEYRVIRLLGKGKGGYSYLVTDGTGEYVLKQIHHEPCSYYTFGNKIEAELRDYDRLTAAGIRLPRMYETDVQAERILKEYIDGPVIADLAKKNAVEPRFFEQAWEMSRQAYAAGLNLDWYPTNFIVHDGLLYYIDYECNLYSDEWNFENWGIRYWYGTPEAE